MSTKEDVKKAFEELEKSQLSITWWDNFRLLRDAINSLTDTPTYPSAEEVREMLKDVRVGDDAKDFRKEWSTVDRVDPDGSFCLSNGYVYSPDGKFSPADIRPSIIAVRKKPRKVKKTKMVWVNEYGMPDGFLTSFDTEMAAKRSAADSKTEPTKVAVPYTMEYEVEE